MVTWTIEFYQGGRQFTDNWMASEKSAGRMRQESSNSRLIVDDPHLAAILDALSGGHPVGALVLSEKRIVLPAPAPYNSCPTCNGTGRI